MLSRAAQQRPGQSLVEFTLGLLVLLLVLAAVVDYGRLLYASIVLTNVAREGAHYGSIAPTDTNGIRQAALDEYQATGLPGRAVAGRYGREPDRSRTVVCMLAPHRSSLPSGTRCALPVRREVPKAAPARHAARGGLRTVRLAAWRRAATVRLEV